MIGRPIACPLASSRRRDFPRCYRPFGSLSDATLSPRQLCFRLLNLWGQP
jgi:hypothetical protein